MSTYGVSDTLTGLFTLLRETPGNNGLKYSHKDVDQVARAIVCRNYGSSCLELCHLLWAIANYPMQGHEPEYKILSFFYLEENISSASCRLYFEQEWQADKQNSIALDKQYLNIVSTGTVFSISPTRVQYLAAFLDFLLNIEPNIAKQAQQFFSNFAADQQNKAIKQLSSELQKWLYQFLSEHLIDAQLQRRFRFVSTWLMKDEDKNPTSTHWLNDSLILDFWQQNINEESLGYKLFQTASQDLIDLYQAQMIQSQRQQAESASTIGEDTEQGEYTADQLEKSLADFYGEHQLLIDILTQEPKCLTKLQSELLSPIVYHQSVLSQIGLTLARKACFGAWQAILVQAKRSNKADVLKEKLNLEPQTYINWLQDLITLEQNMAQTELALLHIFAELKSPYLLVLLPDYLSEQDYQRVQQVLQISAEHAGNWSILENLMLSNWSACLLQVPDFKRLLELAAKSYKQNNKAGFKVLPSIENLVQYQQAQQTLLSSHQQLKHYIENLNQKNQKNQDKQGLVEIFSSDLLIFQDRFNILYGVDNG